MKKTIIAASLLLATLSTSASAFERVDRETLLTAVAATKAEAYTLGVNKLSALKASSPTELSYQVGPGNLEIDSLNIKSGFITVQERADATGKVGYVGVVSVDVGYAFHDSDD